MDKLRVFILCGLVGSGKSTWANAQAKNSSNLFVINKDALRQMLYGEYAYRPESESVIRVTAENIFRLCLGRETSVIIDETNLTRKKRDEYLKIARVYRAETTLVVFPEKEWNLLNRMDSDPRGITMDKWSQVIEGMRRSWEDPTVEEMGQYDIVGTVDRNSQQFSAVDPESVQFGMTATGAQS
jgi:predicted kinase